MPWWVPVFAGLEDGLNPYLLMICAVLLVLWIWQERAGYSPRRSAIIFILAVLVFGLVWDVVFMGALFASPVFHKIFAIGRLVLAAVFMALGLVLVWNWFKGKIWEPTGSKHASPVLVWMVIGFALVMSVANTAWPVNYYITILSNNLLMQGLFWASVIPLVVYAVVRLWLVILLAVLFSMGILPPRMRQMIASAILLSAGSGIVFIF